MRIEGTRGNTATPRQPARPASGLAPFRPDAGAAARIAPQAQTAAATGIGALLALQEVPDPTLARRKAVRRGRILLDGLDELKANLLLGAVAGDSLQRLAATIAEARDASLPGLDALVADIELRARVELAKLGSFPVG